MADSPEIALLTAHCRMECAWSMLPGKAFAEEKVGGIFLLQAEENREGLIGAAWMLCYSYQSRSVFSNSRSLKM